VLVVVVVVVVGNIRNVFPADSSSSSFVDSVDAVLTKVVVVASMLGVEQGLPVLVKAPSGTVYGTNPMQKGCERT
jgi:hypothetical protein